MNNPYETLGVASTATQDEIKNAYRGLAKKFHPDLNPGNKTAEKRFKEIAAAYELVGSAESRAKFDRGEAEQKQEADSRRGPFYHETQAGDGRYTQSFGGMDDDLLRSIFGRMGRGQGGSEFSSDIPGQDTLYRMEVSFRDAALGAEREVTLPGGKRLRVKIPAGVDSGAKLRFAGQGETGRGKARPGDAYVELSVRPSPLFKRAGNDVELELPISIAEAALGAEVTVPTLGGSVLLKVPAGMGSGSRLRIPGKGIPKAGKHGDQYVVLKIIAPPNIDADFKQAVESWSKRQPFDPRAAWVGAKGGSHE